MSITSFLSGFLSHFTQSIIHSIIIHVINSSLQKPLWVRVTRVNNRLSGFISFDGSAWTPISQTALGPPSGSSYYAGLIVASKKATAPTTATISQVTVS